MYILKTKDKSSNYYAGMIGGIITEITSDKDKAEKYETLEEANLKAEELKMNFQPEEY